jgi:hypothetical protein
MFVTGMAVGWLTALVVTGGYMLINKRGEDEN